ncbi:DUF2507 domain-containing protein [Evansella sp. AB-rgal1]|uniref:DUF2507 domain-containing protein n=1 Tax=Evansella sp. AB-rgal1 TaxID=3242696 RepID=UPI00359F0643
MSKNDQWLQRIDSLNLDVSAYSNHILRHVLLPELLGEEEESLLYWAGKSLSRKLQVEDLPTFFEKANWGTLTLEKEKKNERHYELVAPLMEHERPFSLECGFIANWTERQVEFITEATYELKKKKPCTCKIIVRWDTKDRAFTE